jgi:hypothetical protein
MSKSSFRAYCSASHVRIIDDASYEPKELSRMCGYNTLVGMLFACYIRGCEMRGTGSERVPCFDGLVRVVAGLLITCGPVWRRRASGIR